MKTGLMHNSMLTFVMKMKQNSLEKIWKKKQARASTKVIMLVLELKIGAPNFTSVRETRGVE